MPTYYKATRSDGTDFYRGTIDYAAALGSGEVIEHPRPRSRSAAGYLSVSVSPTDCTGMAWPCRLFEVEPVGETWAPSSKLLHNKRACHSLRVIRELPAYKALGPQGVYAATLIERTHMFNSDDRHALHAAWDTALGTARRAAAQYVVEDATRDAGRYAAGQAVGRAAECAARYATRYAAYALVIRDLIGQHGFTQEHYDTLTGSWRRAIGLIHPDDEPVGAGA